MASVGITNKEKNKKKGKEQEGKVAPVGAKPPPSSGKEYKEEEDKSKVTKKDIETAWINAHGLIYPETFVSEFAGTEWNSAKLLLTKLGEDAPAVVDAVIGNWPFFVEKLECDMGLFEQGYMPNLHKIAKYADVAKSWWINGNQLTAKEVSEGKLKNIYNCSGSDVG